jgi:hypothetical protein
MDVQPATMLTPALQRLVDECHSVFDGSSVPPTDDVVSTICGMIGMRLF